MRKRSRLAVRVRILLLLKKIPMNSLELSQSIDCPLNDVKEQLLYLEKEGKVERMHSEKFNEDFWRLKK
jgi:predicted transcriptional regulator